MALGVGLSLRPFFLDRLVEKGVTLLAAISYNKVTPGGLVVTTKEGEKKTIEADPKVSYLADRDVFNRLVPFWQLHLYFSRNGRPDFYADVMEQMRRRPDAGSGNESIRNQFEFVKLCCDVSELDLTDFFEKWGFFWVGEITVNDYRKYDFKITQQMVDDTRSYVAKKRYRKPAEDITLIED